MNTPAYLRLARGRAENLSRTTPIISIVAPSSGTGKTTLIERLIKIFSAQGIRVGVIKSDAHGFTLDVAGKYSHRFQTAGARSVAVVAPNGWFMIQQTDERENFSSIAQRMTGVDLILTEGRTKNFFRRFRCGAESTKSLPTRPLPRFSPTARKFPTRLLNST